VQDLPKYSQLKNDRIDLGSAIPLKKPFTILFEPASLCNFRCICCYYNIPDLYSYMPKGMMTFEDFTKIVDDLAAWEGEKIKVIRIIGFGEPFINKKTGQMVKYLKQSEVTERIEITSNGSLLTPTVSKQLIDAELDYLRVSVYAASQERHEAVTRSKIDIDVIRRNVALLQRLRKEQRREKPFIYVKMLDSFDATENQRFFDRYTDIADEISLEQPHHWLSNDNSARDYAVRKVCPQPFKMLSIRCNGDVIVCDPDWKNNTKVGNALKETIRSIWNGKAIGAFWKMQLENRRWENESCRQCSFLENEAYVLDNLDGLPSDLLKRK
jgi:radical SAM protein with 4Fe4S-binding SPASM domain